MNYERVLKKVENELRDRIGYYYERTHGLGLNKGDECGRLLGIIGELDSVLNIIRYGMVEDDIGGHQDA